MAARTPTFARHLAGLSHRHDSREVFKTFACMSACALANQTREPEYLEAIKPYSRPELDQFVAAFAQLVLDMEADPFTDLLGPAYMDSLGKRGQQWNGEFHTPAPVCRLIARMTASESERSDSTAPITLCEPACGAGAMILAYAEAMPPPARRRLRVTAIDINKTACDMCFVNTSLWGIPCRVLHGDALRLQFWAAWSNIHQIMPWLSLALRIPPQGAPPDIHEATAITRRLEQQLTLEGLS